MEIRLTKTALRTLGKMAANEAATVISKIEQYATEPKALANNVKVLKGGRGVQRLRLRVGDRRVFFRIEGGTMVVLGVPTRVKHTTEAG